MLNIVLVAPEIPQNTGNIARTCAATGSVLHLIKPLGFDISDSAVKRAGLDYWHLVDVRVYESLDDFFGKNEVRQMRLFSTKAPRSYAEADYADGCFLFFGRETKGLPEQFRRRRRVRSPAAVGLPPFEGLWEDERQRIVNRYSNDSPFTIHLILC